MHNINVFILGSYFLLMFVIVNGQESTCPTFCTCRKIAKSTSVEQELLRIQCGGIKNKLTYLNEIDLNPIADSVAQLDLSSNSLSSLLPNLKFPLLVKLNLSKNKLTTLEKNVFNDLPNLQYLDLSSNSLKSINRDWLNGLGNLQRLKLDGNQISTIVRGTFDDLSHLKQLDISNNPLTCDCDLFWLLDWLQAKKVKFGTSPKCAAPPSFKGQKLRKLKVGVEIHCRSPVGNRDPTEIELKPDKNQLIYEGDSLKIRCRAPGITPDIFTGEEPYSSARIYWRFNLEDPIEKFREIKVENRNLDDSGILDSILNIGIISRNHSGQWTCHLSSEKGNHSKSISLYVISNSTKYCPSIVTKNNKGRYFWPRTIVDTVVDQQCEGQQLSGLYPHIIQQTIHYCSEYGTWKNLNTSACPYISEITKILEQFSKVNLNLTKGGDNLLESVRHLKNYTTDGTKLLKDKMDIVFIARTIENYLYFIKTERELGAILIDIISALLNLNKKLLEDAQIEDRSCTRLVRAAEQISEYTPSPQSLKSNLAVDDFRVEPENFDGLTCAWYSNSRTSKRLAKPFFCTTSTNLPYMTFEDELIEASIQIPSTLFKQIGMITNQQQVNNGEHDPTVLSTIQLIVAMYDNNKLFPNFQMKEVIMSPIVGATLVDTIVENLTDPVTVMYRYPLLQDVETPVLAWWDLNINNGIGGWNKNGCVLSHYFHESLIFSCNRLNYFGMLQDIQYAPSNNYITGGGKFHFSHPAIYTGTAILIVCLFLTILTYILCFNSIQMAKRAKHSLINTWLALGLLSYIFTFGIYQTEDIQLCQIIGLILHYLTLSVLLWMCVSMTTMYKRLSKTNTIHLPVDELQSTDQPIQKPILGLYLVGWGIALIICGISGAINIREYATHAYCFLYTGPALSAIFVPSFILTVFIIICSLMIRCTIRCSDVHGQLSEGTQATENVDLDLLEPNLLPIDRSASYRSISSQQSSSNVEDPEHCPSKQLKAHIIVFIFYLLLWVSGALTARRLLKNILPYDERVFSILYAINASMLGAFVLFFYCIARSDVRSNWSHLKRIWCRTRSISDTNMNLHQNSANILQTNTLIPASSAVPNNPVNRSLPPESSEINSRSSSRTSSHTKSQNSSNIRIKAAVDLNNVSLNDPNAEAKIANVNLVVLHRQQYRTNNTIPFYNDNSGAEMFYNPHQSTVARKFFKKQRKNMIKHNNLGTRGSRRVTTANAALDSDNASNLSINNKISLNATQKLAAQYNKNSDIQSTNIFGSGTKINNINIHVEPVKEIKQQNKNILSDSRDENEILIDHVTGSVSRILAERENLKILQQYVTNNDGSPKIQMEDDKIQQNSSSNNELDEKDETIMRTVSQQCSLEYMSDMSLQDGNDDDDDDVLPSEQKNDEISLNQDGDDQDVSECNLTPENNEGMYSITDLSQNLIPDDSCSSVQNDYDSIINIGDEYVIEEDNQLEDSERLYPHTIYENPLHNHLLGISDSNQTLDSEALFKRKHHYQPSSEASIINSSDCDDIHQVRSDDDDEQCAPSSPVSASELDELYEQINNRSAPQVIVHNVDDDRNLSPSLLFSNECRSRSPILFPPSTSFESSLNDIEINTDFRFNAQGIVATTSDEKLASNDGDASDSDEIKVETTV